MITRLYLDGFKTFRDFTIEFAPFTVIAGTNASGKSNLFDALNLLSRLAETDLRSAFSQQRGEAVELFTSYGPDQFAPQLHFEVDMLIDRVVEDNWGGSADLKYTRLRYELVIRRETNERGMDDLKVVREQLTNLKHLEDPWVRKHLPAANIERWRPKVSAGKRGKPYITTEVVNGVITIKLLQDGKAGGRETPANLVAQTVLSGITSVDFPHAFAAKEEMRSWRFLQLNPEDLRRPSPYLDQDTISPSGAHLAAALQRIAEDDPYLLKRISRRLNALIPSITSVSVLDDKVGKQYLVQMRGPDQRVFSSRVMSEGTLRLLVLCALLYDERHKGLICFEEPENGVHPLRLREMMDLLLDLSVDFTDEGDQLRQVIVNTHSPVLLAAMGELDGERRRTLVWFSQLVTHTFTDQQGQRMQFQATRMLPVDWAAQLSMDVTEQEDKIARNQAIEYLNSVSEASNWPPTT
jgi:predicted ATPase